MNIVTTGLQEPDRLAPATHEAIRLAQEEAVRMRTQAVYPEHLLLGVIAQGENKAVKMMCRCGMDMPAIRVRATEVFGPQYVGTDSTNLPLSKESLECIEWAISLLARYGQFALVFPEHLVLGVLHHSRMRQFLTVFSSSIELLQGYLTKGMGLDLPGRSVQVWDREIATTASVSPSAKKCPSCKKEALSHWKHCAYCGTSLARTCLNCGAPLPEINDARFCFECGSPLEHENESTPKQIVKEVLKEMETPESALGYAKGQRVRVLDGPFTEYIGTVDDIDTERNKVTILVTFFGRETPIVLDFLQVEKI